MPHAKTQSSRPLNKGDEMEMRVARLWFWEGYYSRSGVNLKRHYHPEPLLVTDLDLLAYDFGPSLQMRRTIGEIKSGTGRSAPKPLDRIVWLRGLKELVGVDHAELVSSNPPSPRARSLARSIGVSAQSQADLERREQLADIAGVEDAGSHGTRAFLERVWVHKHCSSSQDLERAFWFLRSDVWFYDDITACKRLIGLYRQLGGMWTPDIEDEDSRSTSLASCRSRQRIHPQRGYSRIRSDSSCARLTRCRGRRSLERWPRSRGCDAPNCVGRGQVCWRRLGGG